MIKVVFDTVVFVRSLINPNSWWGKILFQHTDSYRLIVSREVLQEIIEVLQRPEITSLFHTIAGLDKERIIEIISHAEVVEISKDDKFLATARIANAHYLVSADKDLLDLKEYKGVKIIHAEEFLQILEEK